MHFLEGNIVTKLSAGAMNARRQYQLLACQSLGCATLVCEDVFQ